MKKEIKVGMRVRHSLIYEELIVAADENGPAYAGNEFKDNEISLSHAKQEFKAGNISIIEETDSLEGFSGGDWEIGGNTNSMQGIYIHAKGSQLLTVFTSIPEHKANATLICASKDMYRALKVLAELDLTGVTGDIIYQRNKSKILVKDVLAAIEAINKATPKK